MSRSKPKTDLCEACHEREATVFPMMVRDGKMVYGKFCDQCYQSQPGRPQSLQDMIDDLEGKPRRRRTDEK